MVKDIDIVFLLDSEHEYSTSVTEDEYTNCCIVM